MLKEILAAKIQIDHYYVWLSPRAGRYDFC